MIVVWVEVSDVLAQDDKAFLQTGYKGYKIRMREKAFKSFIFTRLIE